MGDLLVCDHIRSGSSSPSEVASFTSADFTAARAKGVRSNKWRLVQTLFLLAEIKRCVCEHAHETMEADPNGLYRDPTDLRRPHSSSISPGLSNSTKGVRDDATTFPPPRWLRSKQERWSTPRTPKQPPPPPPRRRPTTIQTDSGFEATYNEFAKSIPIENGQLTEKPPDISLSAEKPTLYISPISTPPPPPPPRPLTPRYHIPVVEAELHRTTERSPTEQLALGNSTTAQTRTPPPPLPPPRTKSTAKSSSNTESQPAVRCRAESHVLLPAQLVPPSNPPPPPRPPPRPHLRRNDLSSDLNIHGSITCPVSPALPSPPPPPPGSLTRSERICSHANPEPNSDSLTVGMNRKGVLSSPHLAPPDLERHRFLALALGQALTLLSSVLRNTFEHQPNASSQALRETSKGSNRQQLWALTDCASMGSLWMDVRSVLSLVATAKDLPSEMHHVERLIRRALNDSDPSLRMKSADSTGVSSPLVEFHRTHVVSHHVVTLLQYADRLLRGMEDLMQAMSHHGVLMDQFSATVSQVQLHHERKPKRVVQRRVVTRRMVLGPEVMSALIECEQRGIDDDSTFEALLKVVQQDPEFHVQDELEHREEDCDSSDEDVSDSMPSNKFPSEQRRWALVDFDSWATQRYTRSPNRPSSPALNAIVRVPLRRRESASAGLAFVDLRGLDAAFPKYQWNPCFGAQELTVDEEELNEMELQLLRESDVRNGYTGRFIAEAVGEESDLEEDERQILRAFNSFDEMDSDSSTGDDTTIGSVLYPTGVRYHWNLNEPSKSSIHDPYDALVTGDSNEVGLLNTKEEPDWALIPIEGEKTPRKVLSSSFVVSGASPTSLTSQHAQSLFPTSVSYHWKEKKKGEAATEANAFDSDRGTSWLRRSIISLWNRNPFRPMFGIQGTPNDSLGVPLDENRRSGRADRIDSDSDSETALDMRLGESAVNAHRQASSQGAWPPPPPPPRPPPPHSRSFL